MDLEWIKRNLPEEPPKGMLGWAEATLTDDLGEDYTVMEGVRISESPVMQDLMDNIIVGKAIWAERCYCNVCEEEYIAKKVPGMDAFYTCIWEDGTEHYMMPESDLGDEYQISINQHGDEIDCPICGAKTILVHSKRIRGGRTKQIQVSTLQTIGKYTAVLYWLVKHTVEEWGCSYYEVEPRYAYVIGERGGITAFSHRIPGAYGKDVAGKYWTQLTDAHERWDARYSDWGSINNTKCGTCPYPENLPDLDGTTGEKTGLLAYWKGSGVRPIDYLKVWKKWHPVEVLINTGFSHLVEDCIGEGYGTCDPLFALSQVCDFTKRKPNEILQMSKADFNAMRRLSKKPGKEELILWKRYTEAGGKLSAGKFFDQQPDFKMYGLSTAIDLMEQYHDCDIPKIRRYLEKQEMLPREIRTLLDARRLQQVVSGRTELTEEELWPRHLQVTHDRLSEMRTASISKEIAEQYQTGFNKVIERYGELCWTDQNLAVLLPKCNADLIEEGEILRHCVGSYGRSHSQGVNIIFFIRHYRRPERPYYTLNISFAREDGPVRVQLHGYGNERHGRNKQYFHHIPKKVTQFVDRWETEVLRPWWQKQMKNQKKEKIA